MHVIVDPDPVCPTSALPRTRIRAGNSNRLQKRDVENVVLARAVARDKTVLIRLGLGALSGIISAVAAIFTTVIDWKVLGWRYFWLAVCVAGFAGLITCIAKACTRF
jgi:hypothetical protein